MSVESSKAQRHKCLVCGRVFPEGQGIILHLGDEILEFHSAKCFSKFAKALLERIPLDGIKGYIKKTREEYEDLLLEKSKLKSKKIA